MEVGFDKIDHDGFMNRHGNDVHPQIVKIVYKISVVSTHLKPKTKASPSPLKPKTKEMPSQIDHASRHCKTRHLFQSFFDTESAMGVGTRSRLWIRRSFGTGRGKYWVGLVLQITIYYTKRIDLNLISEKCHSTF